MHKLLLGAGLALCTVTLIGVIATKVVRAREHDNVSDVQKIARTLSIICGSSPNDHKVLKVLFYGQSITRSGWHEAVVEHWHQAYPNTVFVIENRALGGFPSQALVRTTEQDIAAFYPDLIIFHVYGDHRDYEKIIRLFRSRTAADIIVQTDHGDVMPDPRCEEGFHLTLHRPPGCTGFLWYRQRMWNDEMSYHKIPTMARKYGLAVEPQRDWWRGYLLRTGTNPRDLLSDEIHPNSRGKELIADFFNRYFDGLVRQYKGETSHDVATLQLTQQERSSGNADVSFDGTRLELVTDRPLTAWPTVTVDGQSPEGLDGCYQVSRTSPVETVPDWPVVRRVVLMHDHVAENWSATLSDFSPDQKRFTFAVQADKSGPEGTGRSEETFVSNSHNLQIEPDDWMVERAWEHSKVALKSPVHIHWSVDYVCGGKPEIIVRDSTTSEYRYVLATGLIDAKHSINIKDSPDDLGKIDHLLAYTPRIRNAELVGGW